MLEIRTISERTERTIAICIRGMPGVIVTRLLEHINASCSMGPRHAQLSADKSEIIANTHSDKEQKEFIFRVKKFLADELRAPASR